MRIGATFVLLATFALMGSSVPVVAEPAGDAGLACPDKYARVENQRPTESRDCKRAANEMDLSECLAHRHTRSEASLRKVLDVLRARLDPADRERFNRAHSAWCAYRDAVCDFDSPPDAVGSMMPGLRHQCLTARNMAKERAVVTLSECIAHDNCPRPHLLFFYEVRPGVD